MKKVRVDLLRDLWLSTGATMETSASTSLGGSVMDWVFRLIRALSFSDEQAFLWIKKKLDLTEDN